MKFAIVMDIFFFNKMFTIEMRAMINLTSTT